MANSVDQDQTAPIGAVCSGSTLFASILNLSVMLGNYLQQTTSADKILDAFFSWRFKGYVYFFAFFVVFRSFQRQKGKIKSFVDILCVLNNDKCLAQNPFERVMVIIYRQSRTTLMAIG